MVIRFETVENSIDYYRNHIGIDANHNEISVNRIDTVETLQLFGIK